MPLHFRAAPNPRRLSADILFSAMSHRIHFMLALSRFEAGGCRELGST
jgi:hypothetical protein